jgi:hypothetical protein
LCRLGDARNVAACRRHDVIWSFLSQGDDLEWLPLLPALFPLTETSNPGGVHLAPIRSTPRAV